MTHIIWVDGWCVLILLSGVIGGLTVLIIHFTAHSCESDSVLCCEDGPNALCCDNGGVCSNINFVFNGTNTDECQCVCDDNFAGYIDIK